MILRVSRKGIETRSVLLPAAPKHWLTPSLSQRPPLCTTARYMYRHRLSYTTSFWQLHTQMCFRGYERPSSQSSTAFLPLSLLSLLFISFCHHHLNLLFSAPLGRVYQSLFPPCFRFIRVSPSALLPPLSVVSRGICHHCVHRALRADAFTQAGGKSRGSFTVCSAPGANTRELSFEITLTLNLLHHWRYARKIALFYLKQTSTSLVTTSHRLFTAVTTGC